MHCRSRVHDIIRVCGCHFWKTLLLPGGFTLASGSFSCRSSLVCPPRFALDWIACHDWSGPCVIGPELSRLHYGGPYRIGIRCRNTGCDVSFRGGSSRMATEASGGHPGRHATHSDYRRGTFLLSLVQVTEATYFSSLQNREYLFLVGNCKDAPVPGAWAVGTERRDGERLPTLIPPRAQRAIRAMDERTQNIREYATDPHG